MRQPSAFTKVCESNTPFKTRSSPRLSAASSPSGTRRQGLIGCTLYSVSGLPAYCDVLCTAELRAGLARGIRRRKRRSKSAGL